MPTCGQCGQWEPGRATVCSECGARMPGSAVDLSPETPTLSARARAAKEERLARIAAGERQLRWERWFGSLRYASIAVGAVLGAVLLMLVGEPPLTVLIATVAGLAIGYVGMAVALTMFMGLADAARSPTAERLANVIGIPLNLIAPVIIAFLGTIAIGRVLP